MLWILVIIIALGVFFWLGPEGKEVRRKAEEARREVEAHRDADQQDRPYTYYIERSGNETLAVRYGIANRNQVVDEYWYHGKGGVPQRNPDRDRTRYEDADRINLRKLGRIATGEYEVELVDFGGRKASARIHPGSELVSEFLPPNHSWSREFGSLERSLNAGGTFTLKELVKLHFDATVGRARR